MNSEKFEVNTEIMISAACANKLVESIGGGDGVGKGETINRTYEACQKHVKAYSGFWKKGFKWSRIKAFLYEEAAVVDFSEMLALSMVNDLEKEANENRQKKALESQKRLQELISQTAASISSLESRDADFYSDQIRAMRAQVREMGQNDRT